MKKAQVSFFIISGIILLIAALLIFYFANNFEQYKQLLIKESEPESFVSSCLRQTLSIGLMELGTYGGYFNPQQTVGIKGYDFTLLDKNTVPSVGDIETQMEEYIRDNLHKCINNITQLQNRGIKVVSSGDPHADVSIYNDNILVIADFPLEVYVKGKQKRLDKFKAQLNRVRIPFVLGYMNQTITMMEEYRGTDATPVDTNGLNVIPIPTRDAVIFDVIDPESILETGVFEIVYAVQ